ncbi:hypothetical protein HTG_17030 [Natrinema mahii]|nr:hypothetical protein HTG_17030 [Natrinema mahii]
MGTKITSQDDAAAGKEDSKEGGLPEEQQELPESRNEAEQAAEEVCEEEADQSKVSEREGKKVADRREEVRDALEDELGIKEQHIFGSFTRGTLVGPLDEDSDTDVMFVLDEEEHGDWIRDPENGPRNSLRRVKRILQNDSRFKRANISVDRNVVAIQFDDFTVEVAPAFERGDDYVIPNTYREGAGWVRTNPRRYKQQFEAVNENRNGNVAKLARLAKKYNEQTGKQISSYHMEVMVYDFMRTRSYQDEPIDRLVDDFFGQLPERLSSGTYDPATDQKIDDGLRNEDREEAISNAKKAREKLQRARERKENNETDSQEHYEEVVDGNIE